MVKTTVLRKPRRNPQHSIWDILSDNAPASLPQRDTSINIDFLPQELQDLIFSYLDAIDLKQFRNSSKRHRIIADDYCLRDRFIHLQWHPDVWQPHFSGALSLADNFDLTTYWNSNGEPAKYSRFHDVASERLVPDLQFLRHARKLRLDGLALNGELSMSSGEHEDCSLRHYHPTATCVLRLLFPKLQYLAQTQTLLNRDKILVVIGVDWNRQKPFYTVDQPMDDATHMVCESILAKPVMTFSLLSMLHEWRHHTRVGYVQAQLLEQKMASFGRSRVSAATQKRRDSDLRLLENRKITTDARIAHVQSLLREIIGDRWSEQFFMAGIDLQHELEQSLFVCQEKEPNNRSPNYVDQSTWARTNDTTRANRQPTALAVLDMFFERSCNARKHGDGAYHWDKEAQSWKVNRVDCLLHLKQKFYPENKVLASKNDQTP